MSGRRTCESCRLTDPEQIYQCARRRNLPDCPAGKRLANRLGRRGAKLRGLLFRETVGAEGQPTPLPGRERHTTSEGTFGLIRGRRIG